MSKKERFEIGWAETDITPKGKCELGGQYYQRVSKGVHSRLGATVLAIKSESGEQAVMISVDLASFPVDLLVALRERVEGLVPEIVPEKIIANATHTHNAPFVKPMRNWWNPSAGAIKTGEYKEFILTRLARAVRSAWRDLQPGALASNFVYTPIGHCRRVLYADGNAEMYGDTSRADFMGLEGNEDACVELMFTYDKDKSSTGVIVNAACPSQVMEAEYLVSSDFAGELRRLLKRRFGGKFHVLYQIASAGDQSPRDLVRDRNDVFWSRRGVAVLGKRLAESVCKAHADVSGRDIISKAEMAHKVRTIALPQRFPARREMETAKRELARLEKIMQSEKAFASFCAEVKRNEKIPGRPGPYDSKLHHFVLARNAEAVVKRWAERGASRNYEMEMHVLRLGDAVFCTNTFELFLDYGLRIKARSRALQTFVVQLSCGGGGYLPTAAAEKHGGYGGLIVNGRVGSTGGKKLVAEALKDINALF